MNNESDYSVSPVGVAMKWVGGIFFAAGVILIIMGFTMNDDNQIIKTNIMNNRQLGLLSLVGGALVWVAGSVMLEMKRETTIQ